LHGGCTPTQELAAALELARREAVVMGVPIDDRDPWQWLKRCIAIAGGELEYATLMVARLAPDEAVGPVVTTHTRPRKYLGGSEVAEDSDDDDIQAQDRIGWVTEVKRGAPELHVWIKVRGAAIDRCAQLAAVAIKAGLAEREVHIAEEAGQAMAELIRGVLGDLGVPLEAPETREIVSRHLRLLGGGQGAGVAGPLDGRQRR
jgi:hypothetical protein